MFQNKIIKLGVKFKDKYRFTKMGENDGIDLYWDAKDDFMKCYFAMEEDLHSLKIRGQSNTNEWKTLSILREESLQLFKKVDKNYPHDNIRSIINWVKGDLYNLILLNENINIILQTTHLNMPKSKCKGIPALLNFINNQQNILDAEHNKMKDTAPPPKMA